MRPGPKRMHRGGRERGWRDEQGGRPGGFHRGGRGGRFFNQGDLRLAVLQLIADKPRHGYEIIKAIEEGTLGVYSPSAGVIYPTLTYLEELGYVTVTETPEGKRLHEITADGRAYLKTNRELADAIAARLNGARKLQDDEQTQQIRRAMDNLKAGLRLRLARAPLTQQEIRKIVDAIDVAAVAVERA